MAREERGIVIRSRLRIRLGISRSVEKRRNGAKAQRRNGRTRLDRYKSLGEGSFSFMKGRQASGVGREAWGLIPKALDQMPDVGCLLPDARCLMPVVLLVIVTSPTKQLSHSRDLRVWCFLKSA